MGFTVYEYDSRLVDGSATDAAREVARCDRFIRRMTGFPCFRDLEAAFAPIKLLWKQYMWRGGRFQSVAHLVELAQGGRRTVHEHTLRPLDEFALAFWCAKVAPTLEEISDRYGFSTPHAETMQLNTMLVVCVLWVPRYYGRPSTDLLARLTPPKISELFGGPGPVKKSVVVVDNYERHVGTASGGYLFAHGTWSEKVHSHSLKTLAATVAGTHFVVFISFSFGGRVDETHAISELLGRIEAKLCVIAADRGFADCVKEGDPFVIPSHLHTRAQFENIEAAVNQVISQYRDGIESVFGRLTLEWCCFRVRVHLPVSAPLPCLLTSSAVADRGPSLSICFHSLRFFLLFCSSSVRRYSFATLASSSLAGA